MDGEARDKPLVLIAGAPGNLGRSLVEALPDEYRIVTESYGTLDRLIR